MGPERGHLKDVRLEVRQREVLVWILLRENLENLKLRKKTCKYIYLFI